MRTQFDWWVWLRRKKPCGVELVCIAMALYITVEKSKQIVTGLCQETLVEDVVRWLCQRNSLTGQYLLVEEWKGCGRPLDPSEKLLQSFSEWGAESRHVTLKLVNREVFRKSRLHIRRKIKGKKKKFRDRSVNISSRHSLTLSNRCCKHHKSLIKRRSEIALRESIKELEQLKILIREEDHVVPTVKKTEAETVSFLNPYLQGEYISSRSSVSKAKQMKKELQKHKKELEQSIGNRQSEILSLETNVEGTQEKVSIPDEHTYLNVLLCLVNNL